MLDLTTPKATISSREIAELCEKRHDHILRDIEKMIQDIGGPSFGASSFETEYTTPQNKQAKEYRLPKDLTVTLITGYRADLRYKVVKRLEERENEGRSQHQIPQTYEEALAAHLNTVRQNKSLQLENSAKDAKIQEIAPKAEAFDRLDLADGDLTLRPASKVLGIPEKKFAHWLQANRWAFRSGGKGSLQAHVDKRNLGYLDHKLGRYENRETGQWDTSIQMMITPKGMARLAILLPRSGLM